MVANSRFKNEKKTRSVRYFVYSFASIDKLNTVVCFTFDSRDLLPEKVGGGVRPASQNPYPIYDQNLRYSLPYL